MMFGFVASSEPCPPRRHPKQSIRIPATPVAAVRMIVSVAICKSSRTGTSRRRFRPEHDRLVHNRRRSALAARLVHHLFVESKPESLHVSRDLLLYLSGQLFSRTLASIERCWSVWSIINCSASRTLDIPSSRMIRRRSRLTSPRHCRMHSRPWHPPPLRRGLTTCPGPSVGLR